MKYLKNFKIFEVAWQGGKASEQLSNSIPLTDNIMNIIYGDDKRINVFHLTSDENINNIKSLIGTRKSISTFTYINDKILLSGGIMNKGGIIFQLEGTLLFHGQHDLLSIPDNTGRRWIKIHQFPLEFKKEHKILFNKWKDKYGIDKYGSAQINNIQQMKEVYKDIEDLVKKYSSKIIKKNYKGQDEEERPWGNQESSYIGDDYNEYVVNNIKIKDILIDATKYDNVDDVIKKLQTITSGKVFKSDNLDETKKWLTDRNGFTDIEEYKKSIGV
jgi:hypothetical protein